MEASDLALEATAARENYQRWLIRWLLIIMGGCALAFVCMIAWASASFGPHVEPRWEWVWGDRRFEHMLKALDAHKPRWVDPNHLEGVLTSRAAPEVNWVQGLAPVSQGRFLAVRQVLDANRIACGIYATDPGAVSYWVDQRYRNWRYVDEGPPPRPLVEVTLPADLSEGTHRIAFPEEFRSLPEFLAVFSTENRRIAPWRWGSGPTCLLVAKPASGEASVIPLNWHNTHPRMGPNSDIERLFRDAVTGRLFGDGAFLRPFVLKEDPRELEAWLR